MPTLVRDFGRILYLVLRHDFDRIVQGGRR